MMTRTISVIAGTSLTLPAVAPNILAIEGYCNGVANTQYFLQLHNAVPVSGVTAPLRSWQIIGLDGFTFNDRDIGLLTANLTQPNAQGTFYLYLSSTDAVFTNPGITCDINCEVEEFELEAVGATYMNAFGGNATYFTVDADVAGSQVSLLAFQITAALNLAPCYVQLFAAPPTFGAVPVLQLDVPGSGLGSIAAGGVAKFSFGPPGKMLFSQDANGTGHYGIYIAVSGTSGIFDSTPEATLNYAWIK